MPKMRTLAPLAAACGMIWSAAATPAAALEMEPVLTLDVAKRIAETCVAMAQQEDWKMHVAVMDVHGNLKYYVRMDGAQLLSHEIAMSKANTTAKIPRSTKTLGDFAYGNPEKSPGAIAFVHGIALFEGGLPIMTADGAHIGGLGVSGSSGANDGICGQAGLDAVADLLQ